MALGIRRVDLATERETLFELFERNLQDVDHLARFDWLYHDNPVGEAWAWFVVAGAEATPVGVASLFPRFFWIDGKAERCGEVGDFGVDAAYRSLGPALKLQRATFGPVDEGLLRFCIDGPPHDRGMATFQRLGMRPVFETTRHRCVVRGDDLVRRYLPPSLGIAQGPLSAGLNVALQSKRRLGSAGGGSGDIQCEALDGPFEEEYDVLDARVGARPNVVRARRFAVDLNWRFARNPLKRHERIAARHQGELVGYLVFSIEPQVLRVADLSVASEPARLALLRAAIATAADRRIDYVDLWTSQPSETVEKAGFVRRELARRVVVYPSDDPGLEDTEWQF